MNNDTEDFSGGTSAREVQKTVIIGLGNPILGDDGVGWRIAEQVKAHLAANTDDRLSSYQNLTIEWYALGGLSLMEQLIGYSHAIIIDAITTHRCPPGTVFTFPLEDLPLQSSTHLSSSHDTTLQNAIHVGKTMGAQLPSQIMIVAVEVEPNFEFSEELTPPIAAAIPEALQAVMTILDQWKLQR